MDEEIDEDESYHEELVKQRIRRHDEILFHGDERGPVYPYNVTSVRCPNLLT
jgi:hypothetical protein